MDFILKPIRQIKRHRAVRQSLKQIREEFPGIRGSMRFEISRRD